MPKRKRQPKNNMAQTHGEQKPVQSMRLDTAYCKQCGSLVQEKGHEHFKPLGIAAAAEAYEPAKIKVTVVEAAPEPITEKPEVFHTGVAEVSAVPSLDW